VQIVFTTVGFFQVSKVYENVPSSGDGNTAGVSLIYKYT